MSKVKSVLLYLLGIGLLIFGNRDVLARITKANSISDKNEKELKPDLKSWSKKKDSVRRDALKVVELRNGVTDSTVVSSEKSISEKGVASQKKVDEKKKKSEVVVAGVKKEKEEQTQKLDEASKTKIEKDQPEKASATE